MWGNRFTNRTRNSWIRTQGPHGGTWPHEGRYSPPPRGCFFCRTSGSQPQLTSDHICFTHMGPMGDPSDPMGAHGPRGEVFPLPPQGYFCCRTSGAQAQFTSDHSCFTPMGPMGAPRGTQGDPWGTWPSGGRYFPPPSPLGEYSCSRTSGSQAQFTYDHSCLTPMGAPRGTQGGPWGTWPSGGRYSPPPPPHRALGVFLLQALRPSSSIHLRPQLLHPHGGPKGDAGGAMGHMGPRGRYPLPGGYFCCKTSGSQAQFTSDPSRLPSSIHFRPQLLHPHGEPHGRPRSPRGHMALK